MERLITYVAERLARLRALDEAHRRRIRTGLLVVLFALLALYQFFFKAPGDFPAGATVHIPRGAALTEIADSLAEEKVIRSPLVFEAFALLFGGDRSVKAGDYHFAEPIAAPRVAYRLLTGAFNLTPVSVTLPEGATSYDMAKLLVAKLPAFRADAFLEEVSGKEGYLFPDTYFFLPNTTADEAARDIEENFLAKVSTVYTDIKASGHSTRDVIIMASILEREAHTPEDRRLISGVLWKRISLGMPLQVDAAFAYVNGKNTYELTTKDLVKDSPYNTYTRKGLPAGPIGNPGLDAILAAAHPTPSNYLYYLSDRSGNVYYAATYAEHLKNKAKYVD